MVLACAVVAGCGGGGEDAPPAPDDVARDVRAVLTAYTEAMGRADFAAACRHLAAPSVAQLAEELDAGTRDCPRLLEQRYGTLGSTARQDLADVVRTFEISGVTATEAPDAVTVAWSAEVDGRRVAIRQPAVRIGGRWQLVLNPSPG
jgi:hypothetical protein